VVSVVNKVDRALITVLLQGQIFDNWWIHKGTSLISFYAGLVHSWL